MVYGISNCKLKVGSRAVKESVTAVTTVAQPVINHEDIGVSSRGLIVDRGYIIPATLSCEIRTEEKDANQLPVEWGAGLTVGLKVFKTLRWLV